MTDGGQDDDTLLRAFAAGDSAAMEVLWRRYRAPVYSWLRRNTGEAADDLCSEAWCRIVRNAATCRKGCFKAWMWRIVRNAAIDWARKSRPAVSLDSPGDGDGCPEIPDVRIVAPDDAAERAELAGRLRAAVERLPPPLKEVATMRILGGLKFEEIAKIVSAPLGTVLGRMRNATARLKKELQDG